MKVGDLITAKYVRTNKIAIILLITKVGHASWAMVQFMHYPKPSKVVLSNFEVISESSL